MKETEAPFLQREGVRDCLSVVCDCLCVRIVQCNEILLRLTSFGMAPYGAQLAYFVVYVDHSSLSGCICVGFMGSVFNLQL